MITRAIITDRDLANGIVQVRIPSIDGIANSKVAPSSDDNLSWAHIACIPGIDIEYEVGDVVFVGFEDNEIEEPVVLGYLKLANKQQSSKVYITAKEITAEDSFTAPLKTKIGKLSYEDISDSIDIVAKNE